MKTQHTKIYGTLLKHCLEENLYFEISILKKCKSTKSSSKTLEKEEQTNPKGSRRKEKRLD